jgi:predicted secreted protein
MPDTIQMSLDLAVGDTGEVPLERYGTAGYAWQTVQVPDGVTDVAIVPRAGGGTMPGAATLEMLRLRATAPGEHVVVLTLRRPWETTVEREVRITVRAR